MPRKTTSTPSRKAESLPSNSNNSHDYARAHTVEQYGPRLSPHHGPVAANTAAKAAVDQGSRSTIAATPGHHIDFEALIDHFDDEDARSVRGELDDDDTDDDDENIDDAINQKFAAIRLYLSLATRFRPSLWRRKCHPVNSMVQNKSSSNLQRHFLPSMIGQSIRVI